MNNLICFFLGVLLATLIAMAYVGDLAFEAREASTSYLECRDVELVETADKLVIEVRK